MPNKCSTKIHIITLIVIIVAAAHTARAQQAAPPPPPPAASQPSEAPPPAAAEVPPPAPAPDTAGAAVPTGNETEVQALNKQAMDAYSNLDYISAQQMLEEAFILCNQLGISGRSLATTFLNLGTLYAGGLRDQVQAIEYYTKALETDRSITLDPRVAGPDATATFEKVRSQMGIVGPAVSTPGGPAPAAPAGPPQPGQAGFWIMKHKRITSAKHMYPIGVYIEVNPMVAIKAASLNFRFPSDSRYQTVAMERKGNLFGLLINCDAIALLDPSAIFYYIEVIGQNGQVIAKEGSAATPMEIKILPEAGFTGQHPLLPGMQAPEKCNPDAVAPCPPWNPHCKDTPCTTDEDCMGRKVCSEGFCQEPKPGEEKEDDEEPLDIPMYLQLGVGTGAGLVSGDVAGKYSDKITLEQGLSLSPFFIRLGFGLFVIDDLAVGLHLRIQAVPAEKFLPMILPTVRYYPINEENMKLHVGLEFDVYGEMRHNIDLKDYNPDTDEWEEYTTTRPSGLQGAGIGTGFVYLFTDMVGVSVDLMIDAMFPTFALNFDLFAGLYLSL